MLHGAKKTSSSSWLQRRELSVQLNWRPHPSRDHWICNLPICHYFPSLTIRKDEKNRTAVQQNVGWLWFQSTQRVSKHPFSKKKRIINLPSDVGFINHSEARRKDPGRGTFLSLWGLGVESCWEKLWSLRDFVFWEASKTNGGSIISIA